MSKINHWDWKNARIRGGEAFFSTWYPKLSKWLESHTDKFKGIYLDYLANRFDLEDFAILEVNIDNPTPYMDQLIEELNAGKHDDFLAAAKEKTACR